MTAILHFLIPPSRLNNTWTIDVLKKCDEFNRFQPRRGNPTCYLAYVPILNGSSNISRTEVVGNVVSGSSCCHAINPPMFLKKKSMFNNNARQLGDVIRGTMVLLMFCILLRPLWRRLCYCCCCVSSAYLEHQSPYLDHEYVGMKQVV